MISLLIDEDSMRRALVRRLRAGGVDAITVAEAGRLGLPDEAQLTFASSHGRAVYTGNVGDYTRLHKHWLAVGLHHAGIVVLTNRHTPVGAQIRGLTKLAQSIDAETMRDRLEYLSNWMR